MADRVVFMGTPAFSVPSLEALAEHYTVVGVVTQPDRPAKRGRKVTPSPVKKAALALGLPVLQPTSLRQAETVAQLRTLEPRVIVVAADGEILRPQVLTIPPAGVINVHPSLLPKYRGASPIIGALLAGEQRTGVTIMLMDEGMDTGPIVKQRAVDIADGDTAGSLGDSLAKLGADLLLEALPEWLEGRIEPKAQDEAKATYTKPVAKGDAILDWSLPAYELWNRVRAYNPRPGASTEWRGTQLKILRARPEPWREGKEEPGLVIELAPGVVAVVCGQGVLVLEEIQLAGKRAVSAGDFVRGQRQFVGSRLGRRA
jgi:methionyl-tRNA formyltransferase